MIRIPVMILSALLLAACTQGGPAPQVAAHLTRDGLRVESDEYGVYNMYPSTFPDAPKPPKGYRPCYLSHYGRHGSRYIQYDTQYVFIHDVLSKAHADGKLTALGEDVFRRYERVYPELKGRGGELTQMGQQQHRGIAERMLSNYPSLFRKGSRIEIRTTNLERTMLSMNAFTNRLCELRPGLDFYIDGSQTEMNYLNPQSPSNPKGTRADLVWRSAKGPWRPEFQAYRDSKIDGDSFAERLFDDLDYAHGLCNPVDLECNLYLFSCHLEGCPVEQVGFFDLFDKSELHDLAQVEAAVFYIEKGGYPDPRSRGDLLAESLLNDFIVKTDEDLENGVNVRLRFGHDGCMIGLFSLIGQPGWNQAASDLDTIWDVWDNSRMTMAANIQLLFCRKGRDVIFTPMFNERQVALPMEEVAPYWYSWEKAREKYSKIVADACETLIRTN